MMSEKRPKSKKIGPRRVRTTPVEGQGAEPSPDRSVEDEPETANSSNEDRLRAEKPPHY